MKYVLITIAVYLASAGSAFAQEVPLDAVAVWTGQRAEKVAWGDVDGDGDLDLACAGLDRPTRVYLNRNGVLEDSASWVSDDVAGTGYNIAWGDGDADGDLDLAISGLGFYENLDGALERTAWGNSSFGCIAWSDIDDDGLLDRIYGYFSGANSAHLSKSPWYWEAERWDNTQAVAVGDMDADGDLDIAFANTSSYRNTIYENINYVLDDSATWISDHIDASYAVAWGDMNSDGHLDLAFGNSGGVDRVYVNAQGVIETTASWVTVDSTDTHDLDWVDIDNDGDLDLACGNAQTLRVYFNRPQGLQQSATTVVLDYTVGDGSVVQMAWGDVDDDGDLDLACGGTTARLYLNNTSVISSTPGWVTGEQHDTYGVAAADVNGDNRPDLACANSGQQNVIYFNEFGHPSATVGWRSQASDSSRALTWGDVDGDGDMDLAVGNWHQPNKVYINHDGILDDTAGWVSQETDFTSSIAWGDFDGDGDLDLACGNHISSPGASTQFTHNRVYVNHNGVLEDSASWTSFDAHYTNSVVWGDIDADGDLDLVCGNSSGWPNVIYFTVNGVLEERYGWESVEHDMTASIDLGDIDGDGYLDLAVSDWYQKRVYFNRNGSLEPIASWTSHNDAYQASCLKLADVDADGDIDMVCANGWWVSQEEPYGSSEPNTIYFNRGGKLERTASWSTRHPSVSLGLAVVDMDADGDPELAFGSILNNTLHTNERWNNCPGEAATPNSEGCIKELYLTSRDESTNQLTWLVQISDNQSDPATLIAEYAYDGGGRWFPATILGNTARLTTSPTGRVYFLTWDADADNVDGHNVWFRVRARTNPDHAGLIHRPARGRMVPVGRLDSRPLISILYPRENDVASNSLSVLGKVWDATNFGDVTIELAALSDTSTWYPAYASSTPQVVFDHIGTVDISGLAPGGYIARLTASDIRANTTVLDRHVTVSTKNAQAPSVVSWFPRLDAENVPANAPIVVQFDNDMNQPSIDNRSLVLYADNGQSYSSSLYDFKSRTLTIVPDRLYSNDRFHYYVTNAALPSQQGVAIGGNHLSWFRTSLSEPTTEIDSLSPSRGERRVSAERDSLRVYYNRPSTHLYVTVFTLDGDSVINDTLPSSGLTGAVPLGHLPPRSYYIVRVSDRPEFDGYADYMSYFITEDTEMPVVMDYTPANNAWLVGLDDEVSVTFNKPLNVFTVDSASFYITGPDGRASGLFDFAVGDVTTITFNPALNYRAGTEYTVVLTSHIQDNIGNHIDSLSWSFTTGVYTTIGYDGGIISSGAAGLRFPAGAVNTETEFGFGFIPDEAITVEPGTEFTGLALDIVPRINLYRDALLTLRIPDSISEAMGGTGRLAFYKYDSSSAAWVFLGGTASGDHLSVAIREMGKYAVFGGGGPVAAESFGGELSLNSRVIRPRSSGVDNELMVSFSLSQPTHVEARIYNTSGRLVRTLMSGTVSDVGENLLRWDGRQTDGAYATDGLYVLLLTAEGHTAQKTFVIMNK